MSQIPQDYVNYKSTPVYTSENVPKIFLHLHNTKAGVYGKICVLSGQLKFYGFVNRRGEVEKELVIDTNEVAISSPQYWHKVEFLEDDSSFRIDFYAKKDSAIVAQNQNERESERNS
ncbi:MAG: tellurite resistance-related uncharacterized protein [Phenylobacterium sp.]|jgi:tellurite resistance-related uncharacterized protein